MLPAVAEEIRPEGMGQVAALAVAEPAKAPGFFYSRSRTGRQIQALHHSPDCRL